MSFQENLNERLLSLNPDSQDKLTSLWKVFGLETEAGKKLFQMYNSKQKMNSKITYPKIPQKQKPKLSDQNLPQNNLPEKPIKIEIRKLNSLNSPSFTRNPKIIAVPKRKNAQQIDAKNQEYFRDIDYKLVPGVNRQTLIEDLQNKFKFAHLKIETLIENKQNLFKFQNCKGKAKLLEKKYVFGEIEKIGEKQKDNPENEMRELNRMFDEIVWEVENKQKKLEELEKNGNKQICEQLKWEILERVSDLEKITKLMRKSAN